MIGRARCPAAQGDAQHAADSMLAEVVFGVRPESLRLIGAARTASNSPSGWWKNSARTPTFTAS
ncbi:hypothetical protein [Saccharopolyspora elongata]|uniref:hypothetical protein n=1 Tax=Saccharopolyspora elongata TaxID=2530387 RepID=UPI001F3B7F83|nr:hypothetical protein [Saccharopolyspora elongata]